MVEVKMFMTEMFESKMTNDEMSKNDINTFCPKVIFMF